MTARSQFARRIAPVFIGNHPIGFGGDFGLYSLAHEETGKQPFEQCSVIVVLELNVQIPGTDRLGHRLPPGLKSMGFFVPLSTRQGLIFRLAPAPTVQLKTIVSSPKQTPKIL
jgi:hypothetical protein